MYTSALVLQELLLEQAQEGCGRGSAIWNTSSWARGKWLTISFELCLLDKSPPQIYYFLLLTITLPDMLLLWRPSQCLCPSFLVAFEGLCFSGCPSQGVLRESLEVPNKGIFDSVHRPILKCFKSCFLRHLFLGCTVLWFMATGENEPEFQHLALGGLRNSCDSQRGFSWSVPASPWPGLGGSSALWSFIFCVVAVQTWPSLLLQRAHLMANMSAEKLRETLPRVAVGIQKV